MYLGREIAARWFCFKIHARQAIHRFRHNSHTKKETKMSDYYIHIESDMPVTTDEGLRIDNIHIKMNCDSEWGAHMLLKVLEEHPRMHARFLELALAYSIGRVSREEINKKDLRPITVPGSEQEQ